MFSVFFAGKNVFVLLCEAFVSLADTYMPETTRDKRMWQFFPRHCDVELSLSCVQPWTALPAILFISNPSFQRV
jgi:hypothetical protein